jgi:hypothetical protein
LDIPQEKILMEETQPQQPELTNQKDKYQMLKENI